MEIMKIKKSDLYTLIIVLFPICNLIGGFFGYYDELIGIFGLFYTWLNVVKKRLDHNLEVIVYILSAITVLGLASNVVSRLCDNLFAISVDALWLWKPFASFILASNIFKDNQIRKRTIKHLYVPAKCTIYFMALLSVIGQFINVGATGGNSILGIKAFRFFWNSAIQSGWLLIACIIIISLSDIKDRKFRKYLIIALIPSILTFSSMIYCWIAISVILFIVLRKDGKFKPVHTIPIVISVLISTWSDLETYFINESSSVRITLIRKGIEVANRYFPLGSGFATYASEMASRYYSKLYIEFGWENSWLFRQNSGFLNDAFFASIAGQFGWISFFLYLVALYKVFKIINSNVIRKRTRVIGVALVLTFCAAMIGSATVKSMMGICLFFILGLVNGSILGSQNKTV